MRKSIAIHRIERAWEIGAHFHPQSMGTFLPSDSHLMEYFTTSVTDSFSHQFLITQENATKSTHELSGFFSTVRLFLLVPKFGDSLKEQTEKPDKMNSFF